ncbi:MAG: cache domain-containing protein [Candidatus Delongbacteria bacterium]|nr:cache domain-containing protein [Candidatus Delongbacteria bacterium]MBN2834215.1 cache domain-containing protein [Candidatus Delongbacteria bacterium]
MKKNIRGTIKKKFTTTTIIFSFFVTILYFIYHSYRIEDEIGNLNSNSIENYKKIIKSNVDYYIENLRKDYLSQIDQLKQEMRNRVRNTEDFYRHYFEDNQQIPPKSITRAVTKAISENEKEYIFIYDLNKNDFYYYPPEEESLFSLDSIETELLNKLIDSGRFFDPDEGGFQLYKWYDHKKKSHGQKLSYMHYFQDQNWIIGTGSFTDDVKNDLLNKYKSKISNYKSPEYQASYMFLIDYQSNVLSNIRFPWLTETNQEELEDKQGKKIVKEMIRIATSSDKGGYLDYFWYKNPDQTPDLKHTYIRGINELEVFVGTGFYRSEIDELNRIKSERLIRYKFINYFLLLFLILSLSTLLYYIIRSFIKKFTLELSQFSKELEKTTVLDKSVRFNFHSFHEFETLSEHFNRIILELDKTRKHLMFSQEIYHKIIQESPFVIQIFDKDGFMIEANNSWEKMWQMKAENAVGTYNIKNDRLAENHGFKNLYHQILQGETVKIGPVYYDPRLNGYEGRARWLIMTASKINTIDDFIIICFSEDCTDKILNSKLLQESEDKFKTFMENSYDMMFITDSNLNLTYINKSFASMVDDSEKYILNENINKFLEKELIPNNIATVKFYSFETMLVSTNSEKKIYVEIKISPIVNDGVFHGIRGIARDITKKKIDEEELLRSKNLSSLGNIAATIAHELNNQMTIVIGYISMILNKSELEGTNRNYLQKAIDASVQTKEFANQLLTFSKGGNPIKSEIKNIALLKDIIQSMVKGTDFLIRFFDNIENEISLEVDIDQMKTVFKAIIENAIQSNPSELIIDIDFKYNYTPSSQNYFIIEIRDYGNGISVDNINKVFDPYFTTKPGAIGLGLSTVHSIITKHNGKVFINSEVGKGTIVQIHLPVSIIKSETNDEFDSIQNVSSVLIMDDEPEILSLCVEIFKDLKCEVQTAIKGEEVLDLLKSNKYDLIILDIVIKNGLGGEETIKAIRKYDKEVKVIVSTGYTNSDIINNFSTFGFDDYITKPFTIEQLVFKIRNLDFTRKSD